jgi:hypothetical protein
MAAVAAVSALRAPQAHTPQTPFYLEKNVGQAPAEVRYIAHAGSQTVFLTGRGKMISQIAGTALSLTPVGGSSHPQPVAEDRRPGILNYFLGNNPKLWHTNVPTYGRVTYHNVYPGIDITFHGQGQQLEYDWVLKPGADPGRIRVRVSGGGTPVLDPRGALHFDGLPILQTVPTVYQRVAGAQHAVAGSYALAGRDTIGFRIGAYVTSMTLVIDPVLQFAETFGGEGDDTPCCVKVDGKGNIYIAGDTNSDRFPKKSSYQRFLQGQTDFFVLKLSPNADLIYGTTVGGADFEYANGLAVDATGRAYVAGSTSSADFLHTLADGNLGGQDAVAFALSPKGNALRYSVVTGGPGTDAANAIALDQHRNAYVAIGLDEGGQTDDLDILKISSGGKIVRRKILGGSGDDRPFGIAVSRAGNITVVGSTASPEFLDGGSIQFRYGGNTDAFVLQLTKNFGESWGSYLGGSDYDSATGIALDASGSAYVVGWTGSGAGFPHTDATPHLSNITCAFIVKVAPDGSRYEYSTLLGSTRDRVIGEAIVVDGQGQATIGGYTDGGLPAVNSVSGWTAFHGGVDDGFLLTLSADGKRLVSTSDFGGGANDAVYGVALGGAGNLFATGQTTSGDFPHTRGQSFNSTGKRDGFLVKIDPHQ